MARASIDDRTKNSSATLVTGGAGYIGSHLVRQLADQGEIVVSMYNRRLSEPYSGVFPVCSDLQSADLLAAPLRGVSTVIHLAWSRNFIGPDPSERDVEASGCFDNRKSLANLISAMEKAKTKRIIFVSALGASRTAENPFLREKYLCEKDIINSLIPEKVIVRSSIAFGNNLSESMFVEAISRVMRFPGVYPLPRSKEHLNLIHVDDLSNLLCNLMRRQTVDPCSLLEVLGKKNHKVEEIFNIVSTHKVRGSRLPLSSVLGGVILPLFERSSTIDKNSPKIRHFLALGKKDTKIEKEAIQCSLSSELPQKLKSFEESFLN